LWASPESHSPRSEMVESVGNAPTSTCLQHHGGLPNRKLRIVNHKFHSGVVADKQCTCPASKLMWERYPPTPPFHCGENEIQARTITSAFVGATPTPATNFQGSDPAARL